MTELGAVIDAFDAHCLGEIHRLLERLQIGGMLIEACIEELETILGVDPMI
jgi:hypothetical protein